MGPGDHKEAAQILADGLTQAAAKLADQFRESARDQTVRLCEHLDNRLDELARQFGYAVGVLESDAETGRDGHGPANVTDGLFAIARALDRLAAAHENVVDIMRGVDRVDTGPVRHVGPDPEADPK